MAPLVPVTFTRVGLNFHTHYLHLPLTHNRRRGATGWRRWCPSPLRRTTIASGAGGQVDGATGARSLCATSWVTATPTNGAAGARPPRAISSTAGYVSRHVRHDSTGQDTTQARMALERVTGRSRCTTRCVTISPPVPHPVLFYPFVVCPLRRALCATPLLCSPSLPRPPSLRARCTAMCKAFPAPLVPPPLCSGCLAVSRLLCALRLSPYPLPLPTFLPSLVAVYYVGTLHTRCTVRTWPASCLVAAGCGCVQRPRAPRVASSVVGHLVFCAPRHRMCILCSVSSKRLSPPCHFLPSSLQPARARCRAMCEATLPLRSPSPLWHPSPVLPLACSSSRTLLCPSSCATGSLAVCLSVPVPPLSPLARTVQSNVRGNPPTRSVPAGPLVSWSLLHPPFLRARCRAMCKATPLPLVPPPPCSGFRVFSRLSRALPLSPYPCPLPTFPPSLGAKHYAGTLHTCCTARTWPASCTIGCALPLW